MPKPENIDQSQAVADGRSGVDDRRLVRHWTISCVEKSSGFLRSFTVIGSREDAEWHFRDTERYADRHSDAWVPKFILPNSQDQEPR